MNKFLSKPYIALVIIFLGILIAFLLVKTKPPIEHTGTGISSRHVEFIQAKLLPYKAKVIAYGTVEPSVTLTTLAEVSGKISYIHPSLKQGDSIKAGTIVARIDPSDYEVSLKQNQADLAANKSSLKQLEIEQQTTRRSLELTRKNLQVEEKELARLLKVWERKLIARSTLDAEEQKVIQLRQQVSELQGQLNTFASRRANIQAQIVRAEQQVKGQKTTLGRTEITLPFSARIGTVSIEKGQFVNVGTILFEALAVNGVEINAQLPILHMRSLVSHLDANGFNSSSMDRVQGILKELKLTARVNLVGDMPDAWWDAEVLRIGESIDPVRRTLGIVVGIDRPYEKVIPGRRPPLLKGMFTAVEISAPQQLAMVIPRKAIHHGRVYVINKDNRLKIIPIKVRQRHGDLVVVESGIVEGDHIIINDLVPVIDRMPLAPQHAVDYEKNLAIRASGTQ